MTTAINRSAADAHGRGDSPRLSRSWRSQCSRAKGRPVSIESSRVPVRGLAVIALERARGDAEQVEQDEHGVEGLLAERPVAIESACRGHYCRGEHHDAPDRSHPKPEIQVLHDRLSPVTPQASEDARAYEEPGVPVVE